ncbi:MAG TPA: tetraacyldisaccharide 4'-kinase [Syntrophales bacterium]|nr:tetraacyldisaccharide 4'-kinase [Syntrophales bacterium]
MINWQNALRRVWDGDYKSWTMFPFFILLLLLSFPYRAVVGCRNFLYDSGILPSKKLSCRVISIGNITTGGTGKTPTVIMLAIMLKAAGYRPAVLSRGYGRKNSKGLQIVSDGRNILKDHDEAGDEPFLIAVMLPEIPILVGSDRYLAGKRAIEELGADILILDDGFQHRRLFRDIDILLLNHARPVGNSHLLPCGSLREEVKALKRADIVLLTGSNPEGNMGPESPPPWVPFLHDFPNIFYGYHKPLKVISSEKNSLPLDWLKGKKIYAFAGIGAPLSFSRTIENLGVSLMGFLSFSDHHVFTAEDILTVRSEAERLHAEIILTTEKDGVRLRNFPDFLEDIFLLRIEMSIIDRSEAFYSLIMQKLAVS